jgi:hypothetical protein
LNIDDDSKYYLITAASTDEDEVPKKTLMLSDIFIELDSGRKKKLRGKVENQNCM